MSSYSSCQSKIEELFEQWIEKGNFYGMGYLQDNDQDWVSGAEAFKDFMIAILSSHTTIKEGEQ